MARMPLNRILPLLLWVPLVGCTQLQQRPRQMTVVPQPAADAPRISLSAADKSVISTVSSRTAPLVTIVDSRPALEKLYYPGQTDPHHWRDAVTVLPMESFQPEFDELLRKQLTDTLQDASRYQALVCEVTSFQVTLDERERGESDLLYGFKTWDDDREQREAAEERDRKRDEELRRQRVRCGQEDERKSTSDVVAGILFDAAVVKPIKSQMARTAKDKKTIVFPQTIPVSLTEGKRSGWNCQLSVQLHVGASGAQRVDVPLQVTAHLLKDDLLSVEQQIQRIVRTAVQELMQQVVTAGL